MPEEVKTQVLSQEEEDDFVFGNTKEEPEKKEPVVEPEKKVEEEPEKEIKTETSIPEKKEVEESPENKTDLEVEKKEETTPGKEEEKKEENDDFFASEFKTEKSEEPTNEFDFKSVASEFDIEAEDKETFIEKINEKIEASKQELKLDTYSPDAQSLIKHLNSEGKIDSFFRNEKIINMQQVITMKPEDKVVYVRTSELINSGIDAEKAREQALEETKSRGTREIKDLADKINGDAENIISSEIKEIVGDREKIEQQRIEQEKIKAEKEVETLKKYVEKQEEFMGIKISSEAKKNIVQEIESGVFDEIANQNPESSKYAAYMIQKFGKKIIDNFVNSASEQNRKGHNAALEKQLSALHKTEDNAQQKKTGHQKASQGQSKNFDSWSDTGLFDDE